MSLVHFVVSETKKVPKHSNKNHNNRDMSKDTEVIRQAEPRGHMRNKDPATWQSIQYPMC